MAEQARVLDVKALNEMAELLSHFRVRIDRIIEDAESEIDRSLREIELAREQAADEVRSAESELEAAEEELRHAESDDDSSDLSDLREQCRECEEQLEAALERLRRLERAQDEVKSTVDRFRSIAADDTNDILHKGVSFLNEKKTQLENYLKLKPPAADSSVSLSGFGISGTSANGGPAMGGARSLLLPKNAFELNLAAKDSALFLRASEDSTKHLKVRAHPIEKHAGKTELYLAIRLAMESHLDRKWPTDKASTYLNDIEQAAAVSKALNDPKNSDRIRKWTAGNWKHRRGLPLRTEFIGGMVLRRGAIGIEEGNQAMVLLRHLESGEIVAWTAYPERSTDAIK